MAMNPIRDYLKERLIRQNYETQVYQKFNEAGMMPNFESLPDSTEITKANRNTALENAELKVFQSVKDKIISELRDKDVRRKEPFEFYGPLNEQVPDEWKPSPGIKQVEFKFHKGRDITADDKVTEQGYKLHPLLKYLLKHKYPHLYGKISNWCRPLGTTKATFADFNKEQIPTKPLKKERINQIMPHVLRILDAKPFLPLHYVDTFSTKMPLGTGTGYHNRHSYIIRAHAKHFSHPIEYANKPTSKGYVINAFCEKARLMIHRIKYEGWPFPMKDNLSEKEYDEIMESFTNKYPTLLFTRCHISKAAESLKQRPVYAVDDLFLIIESMLTFPLHVQARSMNSAIMYGLETIRGGCAYLDTEAQKYRSYLCIDWSSYDQLMPWTIIETFFTLFLPKLIIVNKGYQPTFEYPTHPSLDLPGFPKKMSNLIDFLTWWFFNLTFVSQHGYGYKRTCAGIPSGMLNTQYLDSYCNAFLIVDSLLEFGCQDDEIEEMRFFIMGDDNTAFTHWTIERLTNYFQFLVDYAKERYNMKINEQKSIITQLRHKISILSYDLNFGRPKKDKIKLLAQLCYPERGVIDKWMSMRAIGIAYASCGMDRDTYNFCKDVFQTFQPYAEPPNAATAASLKRYLPGVFRMLDETPDCIRNLEFPSFYTIVDETSRWHGPLDIHPKWDRSHFITEPFYELYDYMTLEDWRNQYE